MNPGDIIEGAAVPDSPKLYVIGCFDKRITFYSQQARALSLVHALYDQGHLKDCKNIAVIGAGAAGVSTAAALLLATDARVALFEKSHNLLPLQGATQRRKIDPHIYDWPKILTTDKAANLPVLDWESGPAKDVRADVVTQFEQIAARCRRLDRRLSHDVTSLQRAGKSYRTTFDRRPIAGVQSADTGQTDNFDMVFLAVGFGLESKKGIAGIRDVSYWSDNGVPGPEFEGRAAPCFFISGNGDGGLIDFVAAASSDFNHGTMIKTITEHSGMDEVRHALQKIETRARSVLAGEPPLDLWQAYEQEIYQLVKDNGLINQIRMQLRIGVQLVLQTRDRELFSISTSALNRLAAYVTIKACEAVQPNSFRHIQADKVSLLDAADSEDFELDCDGTQISAHEVIVRHGTNRAAVRGPFAAIIDGYEKSHNDWLARYGDATLIPTVSADARNFFARLANDAEIPPPPRIQRAAKYPCQFRMTREGAKIHWTGALSKDDFAQIWSAPKLFELILTDGPDALEGVATVLLRVAAHCQNLTVYTDKALWDGLIERVIKDGPAKGLRKPTIGNAAPTGATEEAHIYDVEDLAEALHRNLDQWMLEEVDTYVSRFLADGTEERTDIALTVAKDLRELMTQTWHDWKVSFHANPVLLSNFLCLMVNSSHAEHPAARVLVGKGKIQEINRGVVVSLAIASCWSSVGPKASQPGNLQRKFDDQPEWSGHSFSDRHINGIGTLHNIAQGMWKTDFVILAVEGTPDAERLANLSYRVNPTDGIVFSQPLGHEPVMLSISAEFYSALERGVTALKELLAKVDADRFTRWSNEIEKGLPHE